MAMPITLAGAVGVDGGGVDEALIDPSFFTHDDLAGQLDAETATAIEASLAHHEREAAEAERVAAVAALAEAGNVAAAGAVGAVDDDTADKAFFASIPDADDAAAASGATPAPAATAAHLASAAASSSPSPSPAPQIHLAPFSRPTRDENTPHPLEMVFARRDEFEVWLEGESSWCHFVQRRFTTPEKRAEERLRARVKAHERLVASLPEEQQAMVPGLRRRKRKRTSKVLCKITYTCHHAGKYASRHSTTLPREKLRLNTKKSVKCNCEARIVLSEMEDGECKVTYWWRHEGHDAFAPEELENGRLPKVIDDWLVKQIEAGKSLDDIRRLLNLPEETKAATVTDDPSAVDPDMPPPLALHTRIKYPDIYNRYRKYHGRVRESKTPSSSRGRQTRARSGAANDGEAASGLINDVYDGKVEVDLPAEMLGDMPSLGRAAGADAGGDGMDGGAGQVDGVDVHLAVDAQVHGEIDPDLQLGSALHFGISDHELARLAAEEDAAALARLDEGNPEGLARALLRLPNAAGGEDGGEVGTVDAAAAAAAAHEHHLAVHEGADEAFKDVLGGVDGGAGWLEGRFEA